MTQPWCIFRVAPNRERKFMHLVEAMGHQDCCYTPMGSFMVKQRISNKQVVIKRPVFPGYVFFKMISVAYFAAIEASMVLFVVRHSTDLCYVENEVIEMLREREQHGEFDGIDESTRLKTLSVPGMPVRITSGVFAGKQGKFERITRKNKVWIEVDGVRVIFPLVNDGKSVYELLLLGESLDGDVSDGSGKEHCSRFLESW